MTASLPRRQAADTVDKTTGGLSPYNRRFFSRLKIQPFPQPGRRGISPAEERVRIHPAFIPFPRLHLQRQRAVVSGGTKPVSDFFSQSITPS